jgi:hypothetical protein
LASAQLGSARFAVALPGKPFAAAPKCAHHLVGNQPDAALRAVLAQGWPIRVWGDDAVGAGIGFHQHGSGTDCAGSLKRVSHGISGASPTIVIIGAPERAAVGIWRRHMDDAQRFRLSESSGA